MYDDNHLNNSPFDPSNPQHNKDFIANAKESHEQMAKQKYGGVEWEHYTPPREPISFFDNIFILAFRMWGGVSKKKWNKLEQDAYAGKLMRPKGVYQAGPILKFIIFLFLISPLILFIIFTVVFFF